MGTTRTVHGQVRVVQYTRPNKLHCRVGVLVSGDTPRAIIDPGFSYLIDDAILDKYDHSRKDFHLVTS